MLAQRVGVAALRQGTFANRASTFRYLIASIGATKPFFAQNIPKVALAAGISTSSPLRYVVIIN
jgi:succinate dehydrogenase (ubiquinone) cytochrome b560 subunit